MKKQDRYLIQRGDTYHYYRRVPERLRWLDGRYPWVRQSLRTENIREAREERDRLEVADNRRWRALDAGASAKTAEEQYQAALKFSAISGLPTDVREMNWPEDKMKLVEVLSQLELMMKPLADENVRTGQPIDKDDPRLRESVSAFKAMAGMVEKPEDTVSRAFEIYINDIAVDEKQNKSPNQYRNWFGPKRRAVNNFIQWVGDVPILKITRDQARIFNKEWRERIEAGDVGYSTANRDVDNMNVLFDSYVKWVGEDDLKSPFRGLRFKKPRGQKKAKRVSFSRQWVELQFLGTDKLLKLNEEARDILLVMLETGCRPSEIMNLKAENIRLDDNIPHIRIRFTEGREIKTETSERDIPLVGIALEAMRKYPEGFDRYRDKEDNFSGVVNKFFRNFGLKETSDHTVYCLRHTYEDKMKDGDLDYEMRCEIAGHTIDRSEYGRGFTLEDKQAAMGRIAYEHDYRLVT